MHDPAAFRPKPGLGLVKEEIPVSRNDTPIRPPPLKATEVEANGDVHDGRKEVTEDESLKRALESIPVGKEPAWYARMSAVHSYRSADASAAAYEMSGKAFGAAVEARNESRATKAYLMQVLEDNPTIAAKTKRSMSGTMKSVAIPIMSVPPPPPPMPPLELPRNVSQTGTNYTIPLETLARLEQQIRDRDAQQKERDAKELGKQEALVAQANAFAAKQAEDKAKREKWTFIMGVLVFVGGGVGWALSHFSLLHP
jgi:hypothetical protein